MWAPPYLLQSAQWSMHMLCLWEPCMCECHVWLACWMLRRSANTTDHVSTELCGATHVWPGDSCVLRRVSRSSLYTPPVTRVTRPGALLKKKMQRWIVFSLALALAHSVPGVHADRHNELLGLDGIDGLPSIGTPGAGPGPAPGPSSSSPP